MRVLVMLSFVIANGFIPKVYAAEKGPVSLAKVGAWEINYDIDACHLMAKFGAGEDVVIARFSREQPQNLFALALIGKPVYASAAEVPIQISFGDQASEIKHVAMAGTISTKPAKPLLIISKIRIDGRMNLPEPTESLPDVTPEAEAAVKYISFRTSKTRYYRLETGSLGPPMKALRDCTVNLVKTWGFDASVYMNLKRPALPASDPNEWFRTADYPSDAEGMGQNGFVTFRLDVEDTGAVSGCRILYRTNPDKFADLTCAILRKRAKMVPAEDANGKSVRSFYINSVRWRMAH